MKVAIVGATGETGSSIVDGLLASTHLEFDITALIRPSSLEKQEVYDLEKRGVKIAAADLSGPEDDIARQLIGVDVVISSIFAFSLLEQIPLANAAKKAGVKRFVPCFFATVMPFRGTLGLRDHKEDVLNHIQTLYLPYTVIDVGWWYQLSLPRLPSGRIDTIANPFGDWIAGDGTVLSGITDLRDIGIQVARIITDTRTLNQRVFAYTELLSQNEIYDLIEKLSGEKIKRTYLSSDEINASMIEAKADTANPHRLWVLQYRKSMGLRGDNTPEYASYLGYKIAKDLYPDLKGISFQSFCEEGLRGELKPIYQKTRQEFLDSAEKASTTH